MQLLVATTVRTEHHWTQISLLLSDQNTVQHLCRPAASSQQCVTSQLIWSVWTASDPQHRFHSESQHTEQGPQHMYQPVRGSRRVCAQLDHQQHPPPCPTFNGDDMLPDLVLQQRLLHPLQQLVDGVDVGVDGLEPLDLGADGGRVGQVLLVVHGWAPGLQDAWLMKRKVNDVTSSKLREASEHALLVRISSTNTSATHSCKSLSPHRLKSLVSSATSRGVWLITSAVCLWRRRPGCCCYWPLKAAVSRGVPVPDPGALTDVRQAEQRFPISFQPESDQNRSLSSPAGSKTALRVIADRTRRVKNGLVARWLG